MYTLPKLIGIGWLLCCFWGFGSMFSEVITLISISLFMFMIVPMVSMLIYVNHCYRRFSYHEDTLLHNRISEFTWPE